MNVKLEHVLNFDTTLLYAQADFVLSIMSLAISGWTKGSSGWNVGEQEFREELTKPVFCWTHAQMDVNSNSG
jgi:hypothetical protein